MPFKLGLGGRLGSGAQYMSWVSLEDYVRAVEHALATRMTSLGQSMSRRPASSPTPSSRRVLGRVLSRPTLFPVVPALGMKMVFGEMADTLLASVRQDSSKLRDSGFEFLQPDLESALRTILGRPI